MSRRLPSVTIAIACAAVAFAAGCSSKPLDPSDASGTGGFSGVGGTFVPSRAVDILFLIDDSSDMRSAQTKLDVNFPSFVRTLEALPGGLPDIHIAVISSDMGAGNGSIQGCQGEGKAGRFQYLPRDACTATNLNAGATFFSNVGGVANYTGDLASDLACVAMLGENGCGFEHQLAAIVRALGADGRTLPAENRGFLRPNALLFVVLLTAEDDCSGPASLFDTATNLTLASPLGPPGSFRCNEFGHLCSGSKPPRRAPNGDITDTATLTDCVPAEASGMLTPVATLVSQLRSVKPFPDQQIVVSAITGPAAPYAVHWKSPSTADTGPWPEISHSCTAADTSYADPSVRITAFVDAFGANGRVLSICDESYVPALHLIAERIGDVISL